MRTGTMLRLAIAPTIPHMRFAFRSLRLYRPLPIRNRHLLHARESQLACRTVLGARGSRTERRPPSHAHRRAQLGVPTEEDVASAPPPFLHTPPSLPPVPPATPVAV